jgi:hypothetical protein
VKELENGRLVQFLKRQIFGAHLTGKSVIKTATLLGALTATVCKVMLA